MSRASNGTLSHKSGSLRYSLHRIANETLGKGGIQAAVICPDDVDANEWIAVHAIDFYNDVNLIFGVVQEECTNYSCPIMSAGESYEFLWTDKYKYRKPTRLPAKLYIDYLMNWIVRLLEDDNLFPIEPNIPFPRDYIDKVQNIFRRMFRVYAHIYYSHMTLINRLDLADQFKFSLCHFVYFVDQFHLVGSCDLRPLRELVTQLAPNLRITQEMNDLYEKREQQFQAIKQSGSHQSSVNMAVSLVDEHIALSSQFGSSQTGSDVPQDSSKRGDFFKSSNYAASTSDFVTQGHSQKLGSWVVSGRQRLVTSEEASASLYNSRIVGRTNRPIADSCQSGSLQSPRSQASSQYSRVTVSTTISNSMNEKSGSLKNEFIQGKTKASLPVVSTVVPNSLTELPEQDKNPEIVASEAIGNLVDDSDDALSREIMAVAVKEIETRDEHNEIVNGVDENVILMMWCDI